MGILRDIGAPGLIIIVLGALLIFSLVFFVFFIIPFLAEWHDKGIQRASPHGYNYCHGKRKKGY